ncbi:TPA: hypothetical protein ACQGUY_004327 [Pseudomonas aeruginosa]|uniref:hypothetical protein n=1 Tax=Pseudomonas aeruginosa TaxID=287 RepID=UPI00044B8217|nr:hypothetical protein [Pseudomonas aeruginosa]ALY81702.1 hypothetical protein HV95_01940 [Pseudomonas aeruginosa]EKT7991249.1 hypothetical protein [Pseudomonas aeruginosa]EKU2927399.1 hypothetical protein [Pseudomonas aeruginosa]EKV0215225.1 hypothetical protein [Pseudomonas aeruginosa]EKV9021735.1 hypothetical protein [Pseudomonas aeruginosa]
MSENEKPLKWLRKQDDEWKWAAAYLRERLSAKEMAYLSGDPLTQFSSYENTASSIRQIQETRLDLIIKLQGAIRQRRYRSDSNGRKPRTFTLSKQTLSKLNSIAKRNNADETAVITALIEREGLAAEAERDYKKLLKEAIEQEQKIASQIEASLEAQRDEALKHAERFLKLLAQWELMRPDEKPPAASEEDIAKRVEPRMKELQDAIAYVAFRGSVFTERRT